MYLKPKSQAIATMEQNSPQSSIRPFWKWLAVIAVCYVLMLLVLAAIGSGTASGARADTHQGGGTAIPQGLVVLGLFLGSAYGLQRLFGLGFLLKLLVFCTLVAFAFQKWAEVFLLVCFMGLVAVIAWLWPESGERRKVGLARPAERMRELEELRQQELISEEEYRAKRQEILADL